MQCPPEDDLPAGWDIINYGRERPANVNSYESLLHRRVKKELEAYIYSHEPGERLPSEPSLAKQLGVSRATIRTVLERLAASGVVQKRHGSGTYINPKPFLFQEPFLRYIRYPALSALKGHQPTEHPRTVLKTYTTPEAAQRLGIQENDLCFIVQTVYYADDHFAVFCRDTLPVSLIPPDRQNDFIFTLRHRDLREAIFEETGRKTQQNVTNLQAVLSSEVEALAPYFPAGVPFPLILMCGCCFDHNRHTLFYNEAYLDTRYLDLRLNR